MANHFTCAYIKKLTLNCLRVVALCLHILCCHIRYIIRMYVDVQAEVSYSNRQEGEDDE